MVEIDSRRMVAPWLTVTSDRRGEEARRLVPVVWTDFHTTHIKRWVGSRVFRNRQRIRARPPRRPPFGPMSVAVSPTSAMGCLAFCWFQTRPRGAPWCPRASVRRISKNHMHVAQSGNLSANRRRGGLLSGTDLPAVSRLEPPGRSRNLVYGDCPNPSYNASWRWYGLGEGRHGNN